MVATIVCMEPDPIKSIIFYDGHCGLCHGFVKFVLAQDAAEKFQFAPLQGSTANAKLRGLKLPDSIVLLQNDGALKVRSKAVLQVLGDLGGVWRIVSALLSVFPLALADGVYNLVAKYRRKIFGSKADLCPVMPESLRLRFLP